MIDLNLEFDGGISEFFAESQAVLRERLLESVRAKAFGGVTAGLGGVLVRFKKAGLRVGVRPCVGAFRPTKLGFEAVPCVCTGFDFPLRTIPLPRKALKTVLKAIEGETRRRVADRLVALSEQLAGQFGPLCGRLGGSLTQKVLFVVEPKLMEQDLKLLQLVGEAVLGRFRVGAHPSTHRAKPA